MQKLNFTIRNHNFSAPYFGFFSPKNNFQIPEQCLDAINLTIDQIKVLVDNRENFIADNNKSPEVFLPGNLWNDSFCFNNYQILSQKNPHIINNMRFLTHNFTGFRLLDMSYAEGKNNITSIPENIDEIACLQKDSIPEHVYDFIAITRSMPEKYIASAPRMFGETGWEIGGRVINYDLWATQHRINALYYSGVIEHLEEAVKRKGFCKILEIGAGYGGLAYSIKNILGQHNCHYSVVDLPESLLFSSIYLQTMFKNENNLVVTEETPKPANFEGNTYIANYLLDDCSFAEGEFDLVINTLSLPEMSEQQIEYYASKVKHLIGSSGLFFEQNYYAPAVHSDAKAILTEHFSFRKSLPETPSPHKARGDVDIWSNQYFPNFHDCNINEYWNQIQYEHSSSISRLNSEHKDTELEILQNRINTLKDKLNEKQIVVYGAGQHTKNLLDKTQLSDLNIVALSDKDSRCWGRKIYGFNTISIEEIKNKAQHILISTKAFEAEAKQELYKIFGTTVELHTLYE